MKPQKSGYSRLAKKQCGLKISQNLKSLFYAFICGLAVSVFLYLIGHVLYSTSYENWYQYIGKSYKIPDNITHSDKNIMFAIMAIIGMTFSPIGEELFFRGLVHSSFAKSIGEKKASIVESTAFALTHISHFGLVFVNNKWDIFVIPTMLWVTSMFFLSLLFIYFRQKSDSILGAIICHSAFNFGMIFCIFYLL